MTTATDNARPHIKLITIGQLSTLATQCLHDKGLLGVDFYFDVAIQTDSSTLRLNNTDLLFIIVDNSPTAIDQAVAIAKNARMAGILTLVSVLHHAKSVDYYEGFSTDEQLAQAFDALLTLPMQNLESSQYLMAQDDPILYHIVSGISDIFTHQSLYSIDFSDVKTIFANNQGKLATSSYGIGSGENRAQQAVEDAIVPLALETYESVRMLVSIRASDLTHDEFLTIGDSVRTTIEGDAVVIIASPIIADMGDQLSVTVYVVGE